MVILKIFLRLRVSKVSKLDIICERLNLFSQSIPTFHGKVIEIVSNPLWLAQRKMKKIVATIVHATFITNAIYKLLLSAFA